jgi:uncharacterized protein YceK
MRAFFLFLFMTISLSGCGEIRYGSIGTTSRAHPGDDQNCLTEFSPRESPFCNNP